MSVAAHAQSVVKSGPASLLSPLVRRQRRYRQGVNLIADKGAKTFIDQLMASERSLALEFFCHDQRAEMRIIVALNFDDRLVKSGFDQLCNFRWVHNMKHGAASALTVQGRAV